MLLEAMIIGMCVGRYECNKAPQAYYMSNPELQSRVEYWEKYGKKMIGPYGEDAVIVIAPFAAIASGKPARVKLSNHFSFEYTSTERRALIEWSF